MRLPLVPCLAACVLIASIPALAGGEFVILTPEQLEWRDVPDHEGLKVAFLVGHPEKPGLYAMRVPTGAVPAALPSAS